MTVTAKICGLSTPDSLRAAAAGGAAYAGFVFFEKSPRHVTLDQAAALVAEAPANVRTVGVVVDATDDGLADILDRVPLDMLQLHGRESPARVRDIRRQFGRPVMKAIAVAGPDDVDRARVYEDVADMLLFDARVPETLAGALPGGNGLIFDWRLIRGVQWRIPWMLSGGLDPANVTAAIATSGAAIVDVSSGVESGPGIKDIRKITAFLKAVNEDSL